jgi:hypothetical protein
MKTITATYVWTLCVEVHVPDDATDEQQRDALDTEVLKVELDFKHPIIHDCSNENLID